MPSSGGGTPLTETKIHTNKSHLISQRFPGNEFQNVLNQFAGAAGQEFQPVSGGWKQIPQFLAGAQQGSLSSKQPASADTDNLVSLLELAAKKAKEVSQAADPDSDYVNVWGLPCDPAEKRLCFHRQSTTTSTSTMGPLEKKRKAKKEAERAQILRLSAEMAAKKEWNPFVDPVGPNPSGAVLDTSSEPSSASSNKFDKSGENRRG